MSMHDWWCGLRCGAAVLLLTLVTSMFAQRPAADPASYRADAEAFVELVNRRYAYLDRLPRGRFALTRPLAFEASAVHDRGSLLRFLERAVALLFDHHAITGSAPSDSWALVPSYSDLWIRQDGAGYVVSDVREAMPAAGRVAPGDQVLAVDGVAIEASIEAWWRDLGVDEAGQEAREFAARVLLAGRRDRPRLLTIRHGGGPFYRCTRDHGLVRDTATALPDAHEPRRVSRDRDRPPVG
jgi:carboxyl-terminal processing protease